VVESVAPLLDSCAECLKLLFGVRIRGLLSAFSTEIVVRLLFRAAIVRPAVGRWHYPHLDAADPHHSNIAAKCNSMASNGGTRTHLCSAAFSVAIAR